MKNYYQKILILLSFTCLILGTACPVNTLAASLEKASAVLKARDKRLPKRALPSFQPLLASAVLKARDKRLPKRALPSFQPLLASAPFNLRITREKFAKFVDTLLIEDKNRQINLENIYFNNFDLSTGKLKNDEIFSVKSPKFEPDIFTKKQKQKEKTIENSEDFSGSNIYNISLSGSSPSPENHASATKDTSASDFFYKLNNDDFKEKLKKTASLIKTEGNTDKTRQMLSELEKKVNNNTVNLSNIAKLYIKAGEIQKACKLLEKAEIISPDDFKILYTHAICLYKQNNLTMAKEELKKVAEMKPDFMYAYYNLGNIYFKEKNYHEALDSFKKAMELTPNNEDVYFNIAVTLEMLDYKEIAKKFYSKCLELNPKDKGALQALENLN